jgi:hypothetical protein
MTLQPRGPNMGYLQGWLPPDPGDVALCAKVNDMLRTHARVTLSRRQPGGGLDPGDNIIFVLVIEYFAARKVIEREFAWFQPEELVQTVNVWIDVDLPRYREMDNWVIAH